MNTIAEKIIQGRMEKLAEAHDTRFHTSDRVFESATLGLGDTTLKREVLPDGSHGEIRISTQENDDVLGFSSTSQKYVLINGELVPDTRFGEREVGILRKASVLAKIAFGRVNHWDDESDVVTATTEHDEE